MRVYIAALCLVLCAPSLKATLVDDSGLGGEPYAKKHRRTDSGDVFLEGHLVQRLACQERAKEITKCISRALKIRDSSQDTSPFLTPARDDNPLDIFLRFTNALQGSGLGAADHMALWGSLATTYMKVAERAFTTRQQMQEANRYFYPELRRKTREEGATFEWFSLFCDRLSILMTPPEKRGVKPYHYASKNRSWDNAGIFKYRAALLRSSYEGNPAWLTDEGYRYACGSTGARYTCDVYSPLALSRQFPDIAMMPYPFIMSAKDILMTLPSPDGSHLWLLQFALKEAWADGFLLEPEYFYLHDQYHLSSYIWRLSSAGHSFLNTGQAYVPTNQEHWDYVLYGKRLFFESLRKIQEVASRVSDSEDQDVFNTYFGFDILHENTASIYYGFLACSDHYDHEVTDSFYGFYKNKHYYLHLLPDSLKSRIKNKSAFKRKHAAHVNQFKEDFGRNSQLFNALQKYDPWKYFSELPRKQKKAGATFNPIYLVLSSTIQMKLYKNTTTALSGDYKSYPLSTKSKTIAAITLYPLGSAFNMNKQAPGYGRVEVVYGAPKEIV